MDPNGDWRDTYLELKDKDNQGPGKERDEEGVGDGSYYHSWIWLPNPRAPDAADGDAGEEGASEDDINEVLRVEWTTSFARLERWKEEVELLEEEMRRVVMFLERKSQDWLAKVEAPCGNTTPDIESGLKAYAGKQAAIYHNIALSFTKCWRPTLVSYNLEHSWATAFLIENGVPLTETGELAASTQASAPTPPPTTAVTTGDSPILEEYDYSKDSESSDMESGDSGFESDWKDDFDSDVFTHL